MKKKVEQKVSEEFVRLLFSTRDGKDVLHSLLTPTERTMLAKRLALIIMLEKGYSYYRISKSLKISTSTIKRIHTASREGRYPAISSILRSRKKTGFLDLLETVLMPYAADRKRYAELRNRFRNN